MASIRYKDIEIELQKLNTETPHLEIGYKLLKAFGTSDTYIKRYKTGKGNMADFDGLLIKKSLAYKPVSTLGLTDELEALKKDAKTLKQNPRIIAVSDGVTLLAYDTKENESYENKLDKIWLDFQFFYPLAGVDKYSSVVENEADIKAAVTMAKLHNEIRRYNEFSSGTDVHHLNIFMTRLLFCFFAEDTGIFQKSIFTNYIHQCTQEDGSDLSVSLDTIFNVMDQTSRLDMPNVIKQFPYVNGGLFHQRIAIPQMGYKARQVILECGALNWGEINPDIFGSMIQAVVTPELRGDFGMHYTSVPNILKLIQPLFLNDLEEAFAKAYDNEKQLNALLIRMSKMKFFDPACGSGNFLIITYKQLRQLEIRIWKRIEELTGRHALPFTNISIRQFYGIEIDCFAHEVAMLSLWLAEHQMNALFTKAFTEVHIDALPLKNIENICEGNACRVDWNVVCPHTPDEEVYVFGNPPYLGSRNQNKDQKDEMSFSISLVYGFKKLDYIACWFYLAAKFIQKTNAKSAFVSTNSICQGEQVNILWPAIKELKIEIYFAHTSFVWSNNATNNAGVTVVIIGLRNTSTKENKILYSNNESTIVENISSTLSNSKNFSIEKQLKAISEFPDMRRGNMPNDKEFLRLSTEERREIIEQYPNADKFIRKQIGSNEFINGLTRYCYWIKDEDLQTALNILPIKNAIENCRKYRIESKDDTLHIQANKPHQFRAFFECSEKSLIIPIFSSINREYIPIGFMN